MGVNGTHSFLKKRGFSAQVLSSPMIESVNTVHVDLLGSYYQMVIDNFFLKVPNVAAKLIFTKLGHIFSVDRTILYLDGGRTKEKQETAERRRNVKEKDIRKLNAMFRVAEGKAAQGRPISASQYDALCRLSRRTFTLTDSMKKTLVQIAREEGWNMVACEGEADVHIGGLDLDETDVVISGDSDLLFYPRVQQVLRPMKDRSFHLYRKSKVTAAANVTALQWTCVGIVSGNDYNRNIKGFGIATNCKLISKLKGDKIAQVIALYLKIDRVSDSNEGKVTFDNAIKVFGSQQQELLMRPLENQEEDIENSQQALNSEFYKKRLLDLKRTYINTRKSMRAANRSLVADMKIKPKWKTNRFRPVESKSVAARYSFKEFQDFKKPFTLEKGFKMYKLQPHKTSDKEEEGSSSEKKTKKRKRKKAKSTPSGRSKRRMVDAPGQIDDVEQLEVKTRTVNPTRKKIFELKKTHPVVTLNVGDLSANIRRGTSNRGIEHVVLDTIQKLVKIMSHAKQLVQLATNLFIAYVMDSFPYMDHLCNLARTRILTPLLYGTSGGKVYQQNLLRLIISGQATAVNVDELLVDVVQTSPQAATSIGNRAKIAFQLLKNCYSQATINFQSMDDLYGKLPLSRVLEMFSQVIDTELASHLKGRLPLLQEKVLEYQEDVRFPFDNFDAMDDISIFYFTNKLLPDACRFAMSPQSGFKDCFIDITEEGLLRALCTSDDVKNYIKNVYGLLGPNVTTQQLAHAALTQKGVLIAKVLFRLTQDETDEALRRHKHGYHATVEVLGAPCNKQYILNGTFRTDGQILQLLAFDTRKFKKSSSTDDDVDDDDNHTKDTDSQGVDRLLKKVDAMFPNVDAVRNHFADPEKVAIVGIDLGETFTAAACAINFAVGNENGVRNLTVRRSALYQPTLKARKYIEERKSAKVRSAEQSVPGNKDCSFSASSEYASKRLSAQSVLQSFYSSKRFKRLAHDQKKARRGEFDVATNAILKMAGTHIGRHKMEKEDVLFAIGLGDFNTRTKLSSLHTSFSSHLICKLRSLGYLVVGVDEFYTSKKCPCCQEFVGQVNIRRLYCPKCQKVFHRDTMAGQNIAKVALTQITEFRRPGYLTAPSGEASSSVNATEITLSQLKLSPDLRYRTTVPPQ